MYVIYWHVYKKTHHSPKSCAISQYSAKICRDGRYIDYRGPGIFGTLAHKNTVFQVRIPLLVSIIPELVLKLFGQYKLKSKPHFFSGQFTNSALSPNVEPIHPSNRLLYI